MSRPLRIEYRGAYYHVMNRGTTRQKIFLNDHDRQGFLDLLGETSQMWGLQVYAYCLMDNHYHLLVETADAALSRVMRHLDGIYTQRFNRAQRRDGPLFRGRYRAIVIEPEEYFMAVARYIHRNPVEAQVGVDMSGYRWSSHRGYLDQKRRPQWLNTECLLSRFGKGRQGLAAYRRFMEGEVEKELRGFYQGQYLRPILGGKDFVERIKGKIEGRVQRDEEVSEARRLFRPAIGQIVSAVARVYGKKEAELRNKRRGHGNEARAMAMYLCRELGGHRLREIGAVLGLEKYSSVSSACLSMKARVEREKKLAQQAEQIKKLLLKRQQQT